MVKNFSERNFLATLLVMIFLCVLLIVGCSTSSSGGKTEGQNTTNNQQDQAKAMEGQKSLSEYEKIVQAAKKEGTLIYWGTNPRDFTFKLLEEAFEKRFGFDITIQQVNISAKDMPTRVVAESQSGRGTGDVLWGSLPNLMLLEERKLLKEYPWVETFGKEFPEIKRAMEVIPTPLRGKGLEYYHLVNGLTYNTKKISKEELPKTFKELTDPKWKGKLVISLDATGLDTLIHVMSEADLVNLVKEIKKNEPLIAKGSPEVVEMVATGQATFGIGALSSAEAKQTTGAPIGIAALNPTPVGLTSVYVHPNAPHPNLARLFAAWFATEAKPIYAKSEGRTTIWPGSDNPVAKLITEAGAEISMAKTVESLKKEEDVKGTLSDIISNKR